MTQKFNPTTFLSLFKYSMNVVIVFFGLLQLIFFSEDANLFAVGIIILGWFLANAFILTRYNFINYTFSTFLLLGFVITQYAFPLIFTLLEGKPVTYNLKIPYAVLIHSILALVTLVIAHLVYKNWRKTSENKIFFKTQHFLYKIQLFSAPTNRQLWLMGAIGVVGLAINGLFFGVDSSVNNGNNPIKKIIDGFNIFMYAPLFILSNPLFTLNKRKINLEITKIILYLFLLLIIGMLLNSRGAFMQGISAIGLAFFLGLLIGKLDYRIFKIKYILIGGFIFWVITGPLSDIGTAMVVVRGQRTEISSFELLEKTLTVSQDKEAIYRYKKLALSKIKGVWDETYFDNIFLSRFCNLKYNDSNLIQGLKINEKDTRMFDYSIDSFLSTFPTPVLNLFNIDVDKNKVNSGSVGDYLFFCSGGENAIGGFRTGHFAGTGMAAFRWWYLLVLGIGMIPLFFLIDLFSYKVVISLVGLISITKIFTFLGTSTASESVVSIYNYILRGWIQSIVLYYLIFKVTLFLSKKMTS